MTSFIVCIEMVFIEINDIFDQIKEDNCRLKADLLVANKCIEILSEFKFFLDSIREKFGEKLDKKLEISLKRLDDKYKSVIECRLQREDQKKSKVLIANKVVNRVDNSLKCDWIGCCFSTNRKSRLRAHYNYHTGFRPFNCLKCEKSFVGKESLRTHEKCVHQKRVFLKLKPKINKIKVKKVFSEEKPFKCEKCFYTSKTRQALREHKLTHLERTIVCEFANCDKKFKNKKQLKNHVITHSIDPPFKCNVEDCGAAFRTNKTLKIHLSKHNNSSRVFGCDWPGCDFNSVYNWIVKRHRLIHTGEKPFKCQWPSCDSTFRRSHYLKQHLLKHTGEKPYLCDWPECHKSFQSKQSLKLHQKRH